MLMINYDNDHDITVDGVYDSGRLKYFEAFLVEKKSRYGNRISLDKVLTKSEINTIEVTIASALISLMDNKGV